MSRSRPSVLKRTSEADIADEDARAQRHKKVDEGVAPRRDVKQEGGQLNVLASDCVPQGQCIGQAASRANGDMGRR